MTGKKRTVPYNKLTDELFQQARNMIKEGYYRRDVCKQLNICSHSYSSRLKKEYRYGRAQLEEIEALY